GLCRPGRAGRFGARPLCPGAGPGRLVSPGPRRLPGGGPGRLAWPASLRPLSAPSVPRSGAASVLHLPAALRPPRRTAGAPFGRRRQPRLARARASRAGGGPRDYAPLAPVTSVGTDGDPLRDRHLL